MLTLRGSPALSSFRLHKLQQDFAAAGIPVRAVNAEFVHIVETSGDLSSEQRGVLDQLLTYGPSRAAKEIVGLVQIIAPRPGTISPWSSKATDIAHICGLTAVKRIERVIAYTIEGEDNGPGTRFPFSPFDSAQLQVLRAKLHDRMTQVV